MTVTVLFVYSKYFILDQNIFVMLELSINLLLFEVFQIFLLSNRMKELIIMFSLTCRLWTLIKYNRETNIVHYLLAKMI